mgnify:CR=1 FL=1
MIEVTVKKHKAPQGKLNIQETYSYFELRGHASDSHKVGNHNLLCASVSALAQTLLLYLHEIGSIDQHKIEDGYLCFSLKSNKNQIIATHSINLILGGIKQIMSQYPSELTLEESYVL